MAFLLKFVMMFVVLKAAHGCMCFKGHHQEQYCKSNYVIRGHVIDVRNKLLTNPSNRFQQPLVHAVRVLEVFKDDSQSIFEGDIIVINSHSNSMICGIQLSLGDYLLGGHSDASGHRIGLCDTVVEWRYVPDCQRKSLFNSLYDCGCNIIPCGENEICKSSTDSCKMAFPMEAVENAYCSNISGRCRWRTCPSAQNIFDSYITRFMTRAFRF